MANFEKYLNEGKQAIKEYGDVQKVYNLLMESQKNITSVLSLFDAMDDDMDDENIKKYVSSSARNMQSILKSLKEEIRKVEKL